MMLNCTFLKEEKKQYICGMPNTENDSSYKKIGSGGNWDILNNY